MPRPRIPQRRSRILDAARDLALEKGWRATTVADVASRAGIGKGAVYLDFTDKAAILESVLLRSMRGLTQTVHEQVVASDGPVTLATLYGFAVEALLADPLMRAFSVGDEAVLGDQVRAVTDDRYRLRFAWLVDYIGGLQDAGAIRADLPRDALGRVLSTFTIGLLHSPDALGPVSESQWRQTVALFAELMDRSLAAPAEIDVSAVRTVQAQLLSTLADQLEEMEER